MSGYIILDWATQAVSFFNTGLLIWLGFTVLLNSAKRNWEMVIAASGLFIGAAFFISHSAILGQKLFTSARALNFWWHAGWGPIVAAPYTWYILMLWYTGYWENKHSILHRRHQLWLIVSIFFTFILAALIIFGNPLPTLTPGARFNFDQIPTLQGAPLIMIAFPAYILLCIILALDALLHPASSSRPLANTARQRARPWLTGATFLLLLVSFLVGFVLFFIIDIIRDSSGLLDLYNRSILFLVIFDLLIASSIGAAIMMLGRAIVAYEIFTGHSLPRQALLRDWRRAIALCACISLFSVWALNTQLKPIYILMLTGVLIVTLSSINDWRSFADRDNAMRQLRPFAASQGIYGKILSRNGSTQDEVDFQSLFTTLINDVLNTSRAALVPLGPLASLTPAMMVPPGAFPCLPTREDLQGISRNQTAILLPDTQSGEWMIPLWNEEGLAGVLLLGEKMDGGFYSQEEIDIACAGGERLLDTRASAEIARRLVELQRQRMVQSAILDRRTRRVLHDDVLPRLHSALLRYSIQPHADIPESQKTLQLLTETHRQISELLREIPPTPLPDLQQGGVVNALRSIIKSELTDCFDEVHWQVNPDAESGLASLPELTAEVVYFAAREVLRNAAHHGRGSQNSERALHLEIRVHGDSRYWNIIITDDGVGLHTPATENKSGSGQGLALHSTLMAVVGASMSVESEDDCFTRVSLKIPCGNDHAVFD